MKITLIMTTCGKNRHYFAMYKLGVFYNTKVVLARTFA
jgi:hypothetical protein